MRIRLSQLRSIIAEEVRRSLLSERADSADRVQRFADSVGVAVDDVHALWDWSAAHIEDGTPFEDGSPESELYTQLIDSGIADMSDVQSSIEASGGAARLSSGPSY